MRSAAALFGLFVVGSLAFNACGGDDGDDDSLTGGSGGTSGKGGSGAKGGASAGEGGEAPAKGGKGGSGAKGGKGGSTGATGGSSSGKGGSGAKGGTGATGGGGGDDLAGSSGSSGEDSAGGTAGHGGSSGAGGTAGLAGASGAGAGGEGGGEAGTGGTGPMAKACTYECDGNEDCNPGAGIVCIGGECLDEARACETDEACIAWLNNLSEDCATDADCDYHEDFGDLCIDIDGVGRCAMIPYPDCAFGEPNDLPRFGASGTATVCAALSGRCENHECRNGCTSEPDFCATRDEGGPICNEITGHCSECTRNPDCSNVPGAPFCNVPTGKCECHDSADCAGILGMPDCVAGVCSCSSETTCTKFPSAVASCQ